MNKQYYTTEQTKVMLHTIIRWMQRDNWKPELIVGITRGGLVPAVQLSHYLEVPMQILNVSFRDGKEVVSNVELAQLAFGSRTNMLIIDDINDTGRTLNWIKNDWEKNWHPENPAWNEVWHCNVRFATLVDNVDSNFLEVDYPANSINKGENPAWIVFPWENWWE